MTLIELTIKIVEWVQALAAARGIDPSWAGFATEVAIMCVLGGIVLAMVSVAGMLLIWMERKVSAHMQSRIGPNRVGPFGLFQSVADAVKLLLKEDISPRGKDLISFWLAPMLISVPAVMSFACFPYHKGWIPIDLDLGLLYLMAIGSAAVIIIFMAGYGSNNKYSMLGGMRTIAQIITYEIPAVLAVTAVVMTTGSLKMSTIVDAQSQVWNIFSVWGLIAFIIYIICATAETNRTPFDLPEAESELVAGYHTEYTGMKFALFFVAEYTNMVVVSAIASAVFLGGYYGPFGLGGASPVWMLLKVIAMIYLMMWFRWTFPRLRIDQMMMFGWKVLLPISFANIVLVGIWMAFKTLGQ